MKIFNYQFSIFNQFSIDQFTDCLNIYSLDLKWKLENWKMEIGATEGSDSCQS